MIGPVERVLHVAIGLETPQISVVNRSARLVDNRRVPVARFVGRLAQLTGNRELAVVGLGESTRFTQLAQMLAIDPETYKRRLVGIGQHAVAVVIDVAHERAGSRCAQHVDFAFLQHEVHRRITAHALPRFLDGNHGGFHLKHERFGLHGWVLKLGLQVHRHHIDTHIGRWAQRVETIAIQRAYQLKLARVAVIKKVVEVLVHGIPIAIFNGCHCTPFIARQVAYDALRFFDECRRKHNREVRRFPESCQASRAFENV